MARRKIVRGVRPLTKHARRLSKQIAREFLDPLFHRFASGLADATAARQAHRIMGEIVEDLAASPHDGVPLALIQEHMHSLNGYHRELVRQRFRRALGIDVSGALAQQPIQAFVLERIEASTALIKTLPGRAVDNFTARLTKFAEAGGDPRGIFDPAFIQEQLADTSRAAGYQMRRIVRDQNNKAIGGFNQIRQQELGVQSYEWMTANDLRVRPSHEQNNGQTFTWAEPPPDTGHPGWDIQCRCVANAVISSIPRQQLTYEQLPAPAPRAATTIPGLPAGSGFGRLLATGSADDVAKAFARLSPDEKTFVRRAEPQMDAASASKLPRPQESLPQFEGSRGLTAAFESGDPTKMRGEWLLTRPENKQLVLDADIPAAWKELIPGYRTGEIAARTTPTFEYVAGTRVKGVEGWSPRHEPAKFRGRERKIVRGDAHEDLPAQANFDSAAQRHDRTFMETIRTSPRVKRVDGFPVWGTYEDWMDWLNQQAGGDFVGAVRKAVTKENTVAYKAVKEGDLREFIVPDRRLKHQSELAGRPSGNYGIAEKNLYDFDDDEIQAALDAGRPGVLPQYASIGSKEAHADPFWINSSYGDIVLRFKTNKVWDRSTVIYGDSFYNDDVVGVSMLNDINDSIAHKLIQYLSDEDTHDKTKAILHRFMDTGDVRFFQALDGEDFMEVHVFGDVGIDDIESIVVPGKARRAEIRQFLDENGWEDVPLEAPVWSQDTLRAVELPYSSTSGRIAGQHYDNEWLELGPGEVGYFGGEPAETWIAKWHDRTGGEWDADRIGSFLRGPNRRSGAGFEITDEEIDRLVADLDSQKARIAEIGERAQARAAALQSGEFAELAPIPDDELQAIMRTIATANKFRALDDVGGVRQSKEFAFNPRMGGAERLEVIEQTLRDRLENADELEVLKRPELMQQLLLDPKFGVR